ncbi:MAG: hypothetical protein M5R36_24380 [Deltaproteobacteria bacterium]|nr:hypothetical protein [Deltaproteobacteria bacterium]
MTARGRGDAHRFEAESLAGLREEILARAQDDRMLEPLTRRLTRWLGDGLHTVLVARSPSGVDRLRRLLDLYGFEATDQEGLTMARVLARPPSARVPVMTGDLSAGAVIPSLETAIVTEEEIFGPRRHAEAYRGKRGEPVADFSDLAEGDAVVHLTHGIGLFKGMTRLALRGRDGEFLHLEYSGGDKLYVPVDRLAQVHRYVGAGAAASLDKLGARVGSVRWIGPASRSAVWRRNSSSFTRAARCPPATPLPKAAKPSRSSRRPFPTTKRRTSSPPSAMFSATCVPRKPWTG